MRDVEARGADDCVEGVEGVVFGSDADFFDAKDGGGDEADVVAGEGLEIARSRCGPATADFPLWCEFLGEV